MNVTRLTPMRPSAKLKTLTGNSGTKRMTMATRQSRSRSCSSTHRSAFCGTVLGNLRLRPRRCPNSNASAALSMLPTHDTVKPSQKPKSAPFAARTSSPGNGMKVWTTRSTIATTGPQGPHRATAARTWSPRTLLRVSGSRRICGYAAASKTSAIAIQIIVRIGLRLCAADSEAARRDDRVIRRVWLGDEGHEPSLRSARQSGPAPLHDLQWVEQGGPRAIKAPVTAGGQASEDVDTAPSAARADGRSPRRFGHVPLRGVVPLLSGGTSRRDLWLRIRGQAVRVRRRRESWGPQSSCQGPRHGGSPRPRGDDGGSPHGRLYGSGYAAAVPVVAGTDDSGDPVLTSGPNAAPPPVAGADHRQLDPVPADHSGRILDGFDLHHGGVPVASESRAQHVGADQRRRAGSLYVQRRHHRAERRSDFLRGGRDARHVRALRPLDGDAVPAWYLGCPPGPLQPGATPGPGSA